MNRIVLFERFKQLFTVIAFFITATFYSQNLLTNGDFEIGSNGVGFSINSSFYNEITTPFSGNTVPGNYAVTTNPQPMNTALFISGGDHTTGTGKMLVVDGSSTGGSQRFWRAGNSGGGVCALTVGATYRFSFWIKSVSTTVTNNATRANIGYQFNQATNVVLVSGSDTAPLPAAGWQQVVHTFTANNFCVNIEMWDNNTSAVGNDFAVDDFSLIELSPLSLTFSSTNISCPNANDGTIIAIAAHGIPPYNNYQLTGAVNQSNTTGIFSGLPAGTYTISVTDSENITVSQSITLTAPASLVTSPNVAICAGGLTTLSVSNGLPPYTWTASPADASLTTPNISNPTVSPSVTTIYTVTSSSSNNTNLIFNGNFSAGNSGFTSDYIYNNPTNQTLAQRTYGVVSNAHDWESGFGTCTDHTTGTGLMFIADGSTVNAGNDLVWGQNVVVLPNQNYTFGYWIQTVATPSPAIIRTLINGALIGTATAPVTVCGWTHYTYTWNSGAAILAQIRLYDQNTASGGNDFTLDDISLTASSSCSLSETVTITVNPLLSPVISCGTSTASSVTFNWAAVTGATVYTISYAVNNGQFVNVSSQSGTTFTVPGLNPNDAVVIRVTPVGAVGTCFTMGTQTCVASQPVNCTPNFAPIPAFCAGTAAPVLATTSPNGIVGTWSPAVISNTVSGIYIFTPNAPCSASTQSLSVTVNQNIAPNFPQIAAVCPGSNVPVLAATSPNGVSGTWFPATVSNTASGIYLFTPNAGQCATTQALNVTVTLNVAPNFATIAPICSGGIVPTLTATSPNGITGTWSPATISNTTSAAYTFTPNAGQCGATQVLNVTITPKATPDFPTIQPFCAGENAPTLATNSPNGISGTWSPATVSNTEDGTYTFTPNQTECATQQVLNVSVTSPAQFSIVGGCDSGSYILQAIPASGTFDVNILTFHWEDENGNEVGLNLPTLNVTAAIKETTVTETFPLTYNLTISENGGCPSYRQYTVNDVYCLIPKGVSHNGDTKNENFDLTNLGVTHLDIFNRYGTKVYSKDNYTNEWIGQSDAGKQLPDATYYYYLEFKRGQPKTGWVYLISK